MFNAVARFIVAVCITGMVLWGCKGKEQRAGANYADSTIVTGSNPLSSWKDGAAKQRILAYFKAATDSTNAGYVPVDKRLLVTDNDGTLWPEQPFPFQLIFTLDFIRANAATHPEWKNIPVVKAIVANDKAGLMKAGERGLMQAMFLAHSGMTTDQFDASVRQWIDTARDARFHKRYTELVYQPMLELLELAKKHRFRVFVVSGGGADFMRVWAPQAYGIPASQVIGSYNAVKYEVKDGKPVLTKLPENILPDDKQNKPVAIRQFIGQQPVICLGNSDGDQAMMQYTSANKYPSLCLIVKHTDSTREYQYDVHTLSGHLETALKEAAQKNWLVVDMQKDFAKVFAWE
ncbi:HAD family hydrolase [Deminuibacter soli]|uniref:Haloacid dehalogenase-like hydrolase n=1 Tax=Deminuibacter soli TaxID=2291815 RepID=A0A3E1NHA1_9BACT|nr:HAD family hydrolase [Deminuibacter soli]RFM27323.1 haloacid dehalogenase-like hydrolase [Deminuibacter soli]